MSFATFFTLVASVLSIKGPCVTTHAQGGKEEAFSVWLIYLARLQMRANMGEIYAITRKMSLRCFCLLSLTPASTRRHRVQFNGSTFKTVESKSIDMIGQWISLQNKLESHEFSDITVNDQNIWLVSVCKNK